jgi:hypothetical protein
MGRAFCRLGVHGHEAPAKLLLLVICSIISPILFFSGLESYLMIICAFPFLYPPLYPIALCI